MWSGCLGDHVKEWKQLSGDQASNECLGIHFNWFLHINNLLLGWSHLFMFPNPSPPFFPMYGKLIQEKMWICGTSNWEQVGFAKWSLCAGSVGVAGNSRCSRIINVFADKQWLNNTCSGVYRLHLTKWATAPGAARDAQVFCDDKSLEAKQQLLPRKQT